MKPQIVCDEVARMLEIEEADALTPGFFSMRMPTIKNILEGMTPEEKAELDKEKERISNEGYPEEIKRK